MMETSAAKDFNCKQFHLLPARTPTMSLTSLKQNPSPSTCLAVVFCGFCVDVRNVVRFLAVFKCFVKPVFKRYDKKVSCLCLTSINGIWQEIEVRVPSVRPSSAQMMFGLEVMINCMGQVAIQCLMVLQGVPNVDEQIREMCFLWVGFELFAQLFGQNFYASGCE